MLGSGYFDPERIFFPIALKITYFSHLVYTTTIIINNNKKGSLLLSIIIIIIIS